MMLIGDKGIQKTRELMNGGVWKELKLKRGEKLLGFIGTVFTDENNEMRTNGFKMLKLIIGPDLSPIIPE